MKTGLTLLKGAVLLVGLCVAGLLGACGYQYWALSAVTRDLDTEKVALTHAQHQRAVQDTDRDTALHLATYVARRDTKWSWSEQLPVMVKQIVTLTKGSDTVIDTLQPAPVMGKTALVRYPLRLTLHGSLSGLTTLLRQVRGATPVLAVDGLTIRSGQKAADPLQVELTLSAYVLLEDQRESGGDA